MTSHVLVIDPIPGKGFWTPWSCICGAGGTGADVKGAENQYELHVAGHWPAFIEPVPGCEPFEWKGKTLWSPR